MPLNYNINFMKKIYLLFSKHNRIELVNREVKGSIINTKGLRSFMLIIMAIFLNFGFEQFTCKGVNYVSPGAGWKYGRLITVAATPVAGYQVCVILTPANTSDLNTAGCFKSDGSDIRFTDATNILSYWIEGSFTTTGTTNIWVKVQNAGTTTLVMYYGNPSATAVSNGGTTFNFFEDFTTPSTSSTWGPSITLGSITYNSTAANGVVTLTVNANAAAGVSISKAYSVPASSSYTIEIKHYETGRYHRLRMNTSPASQPSGDFGIFANAGTTTAEVYYVGWSGPDNVFNLGSCTTAGTCSTPSWYLTNYQLVDGGAIGSFKWYNYSYAANFSYGSLTQVGTTATNAAAISSSIRGISVNIATDGVTSFISHSVNVDWILVRLGTSAPSIGTVGAFVYTPSSLTASIQSQINETCPGKNDGSATATTSGGNGTSAYLWPGGITTATKSGLTLGAYTVTVTDAYGFSVAATATITDVGLSVPTGVSASPSSICVGASTSLTATSTGNYINWYTASTGGSPVSSTPSGTNYVITPAGSATYYAEAQQLAAGTQTFSYTGAQQTFTVPAGVTSINIDAYGAQGSNNLSLNGQPGGYGGQASGILTVTPGATIYVYVGGQAGFNGGGAPGAGGSYPGVYGGGASDVRVGGTGTGNRVIVAAGGGGGGNGGSSWSGYAGGVGGSSGGVGAGCCGTQAAGGTQSGGGTGGQDCGGCGYGGTAGTSGLGGTGSLACSSYGTGSGGGGGYYGGGGGSTCGSGGSGGGGSSWTGGVSSGSTTSGARTGNGQVTITYSGFSSCISSSRVQVPLTINGPPVLTAGSNSPTMCGKFAEPDCNNSRRSNISLGRS